MVISADIFAVLLAIFLGFLWKFDNRQSSLKCSNSNDHCKFLPFGKPELFRVKFESSDFSSTGEVSEIDTNILCSSILYLSKSS